MAVTSPSEHPVQLARIVRMNSRPELGVTKASVTFSPLMNSLAFLGGSGVLDFQT